MLDEHTSGRAVDTCSRDLATPAFGVAPNLKNARWKRLPGEPPFAHVRHLILSPRLVLRMPYAGGIGKKAARLSVLAGSCG